MKKTRILALVLCALMLLAMFRMLSRNISRRRQEDMAYCRLAQRFLQAVAPYRKRWMERKTHRYFHCPQCRATLRVPRGRGKIRITCRVCRHEFDRTT